MLTSQDAMLLPIYRSAVRQFDQRVQAVRPEQWSLSTPDADWDVHRLVRHVITGQAAAPTLLGAADRPAERLAATASPADLLAGWTAASSAAVAVLGAVPGDQPLTLPDGDTTVAAVGWRLATELTVHGWDLARAIAAPDEFPNDLLAHVLDHAKNNAAVWFPAERYRTPIPVPGCTDDLTELLALTGRNRWWRRQS